MDKSKRKIHAPSMGEEFKRNIKKAKKIRVVTAMLKLFILTVIVIGIPLYILFYHREFLVRFDSLEEVTAFLNMYRAESVLIYIAVQVIQIVISFIPGQAFQFAAGYLFGFPMGLVYSVIGAVAGTTAAYYMARFLGSDAMLLFFGKERVGYFLERLNSKRAYIIVFLLFLIPGFPKDMISYLAGISRMPFKLFLIISLLGRIPGMAGSLLIGALCFKGHYAGMALTGVLAVLILFWCVAKRKKIRLYVDRFCDRMAE